MKVHELYKLMPECDVTEVIVHGRIVRFDPVALTNYNSSGETSSLASQITAVESGQVTDRPGRYVDDLWDRHK